MSGKLQSGKRLLLMASIGLLFVEGTAMAQSRQDLVNLGIGLGGLVLNDMMKQPSRRPRPNVVLEGPVEGNRRNSPGPGGRSTQRTKPPRPAPQPSAQEIAEREAAKRERKQAELARKQADAQQKAELRDVQSRLNRLNFAAGDEDGRPGGKTTKAIQAFQASIGASQTGELTQTEKILLVNASDGSSSQFAFEGDLAPLDMPGGTETPGAGTSEDERPEGERIVADTTQALDGGPLDQATSLPEPSTLPAPVN